MTGSASRFVTACALAAVVLPAPSPLDSPVNPAPRKGSGRTTPPTSKAAATPRPRRSTRRISRSSKSAWRFKTDNLGPFPEFKLEGTPLMVTACSTRPAARVDR